MGGVLKGLTAMGMAQAEGSAKAWAASEDAHNEQVGLDYSASQATRKGALESSRLRALGSELIARQQTAYTNSGVEASSGTAASVMADTRLMSEKDAMTAENNAAREAWGYRVKRDQSKANLQRTLESLNRELIGKDLNAAGDIIGSAASMGGGGMGGG